MDEVGRRGTPSTARPRDAGPGFRGQGVGANTSDAGPDANPLGTPNGPVARHRSTSTGKDLESLGLGPGRRATGGTTGAGRVPRPEARRHRE